MSGGFFRGTSADQDTRFSNKQAKLLKSQKFAPELEQLVDMTKVKMDVMRPWIATRVTELIGFEDEVLINFIYGLLDGKEVNGKEVQISLTGFMERNTGKFMKELWSLLVSAQNNASGVPQQFLDAKEEETKMKKAESDRIANEIRRKKEKESQELEQERTKQMDRGNDVVKDVDTDLQPNSKYQPKARSLEEKKSEERNGLQGRSRFSKSPHSADHSSSPRRRSRSLSASPKQRGRSSSSDMVQHYSPRYSLSPRRRNSPRRSFTPRRRSSHSRRRSLSRSRRRSPSPIRYRKRSPLHRRSRSLPRHRSRSPIWRRPRSPTRRSSPRDLSESPIQRQSSSVRRRSPPLTRRRSPSPTRYRSPSPMRRKYRRSSSTPRRRSPPPIRRRSPSPIRHRSPSPIRRRSRSPIRRRSPRIRRRSPSPFRRLSPSPIRRRSPIAGRQRSPSPANDRSPSPQVSSSPSPPRSSRSPVRRISPRRQRKSPLQSPRGRIRRHEKHSPGQRTTPSDTVEHRIAARQRSNSSESRSRSNSWNRNDSHRKVKRSPISPQGSPSVSEAEKETNLIEKRREKISHFESPNPGRKAIENKHGSFEMSADDKETNEFREAAKRKHNSSGKVSSSDQHKGLHVKGKNKDDPVQTQGRADRIELNKTDEVLNRGNKSEKVDHQETPGQQDSKISTNTFYSEKGKESPIGGHREKIDDLHFEAVRKLSRKVEQNAQSASIGSDSDESDKSRAKIKDKRKKKRAEKHALESADESSYDSYAEVRKEAKRRRKEEKRLKKEERRRRREERRRRKEERRAEKRRLKSSHAVSSSSDVDRNRDDCSDDEQRVQKKIEIELREKALESFRAKKGIGH